MNHSESKLSLLFLSVDYFLLSLSFFALNYLKREAFRLPEDYFKLLIGFFAISLIVSLFTQKYRPSDYKSYYKGLFILTKSMVFIIYGISFFIVLANLSKFSRIHIFGTFIAWFILEIILFSIYYESLGKNIIKKLGKIDIESILKSKISSFILISDFLFLISAFFLLNLYKRQSLVLSPDYEKVLLIIIGLWFFVSALTRKFDFNNFDNYFFAMAACIKAVILMAFIVSVIIYSFKLFYFSRLHIYGTLILLFVLEVLFCYFYFKLKFNRNAKVDHESVKRMNRILHQEELPIRNNRNGVETPSFMKILSERCLRSYPGLFDFVEKILSFDDLDASEIALVKSPDRIHLKILGKNPLSLFINLHKLNDIRWINRYLLEIHEHLLNGGNFIGRAITIDVHKKNFFGKYPKYYSNILYMFHFIFFRIFPKLPILKKIYFALTKGKGRVLSRAEVLGRLSFCGFEILAEEEINGSFFFIAQKIKTPSLDPSPTYGPLVKLKRAGLNGKIIHVYKFRTMYPYSEYLQDYIYKRQNLKSGGKIKDDFRVTEYGNFMRRYWLDELPMLYNWLRGELKLFGVRPLSKHYLGLYDRSLRRMRQKVKPGVIPPYYADLPQKIEEIAESEKKYIKAYFSHPVKTQWIYFWKVMNNIIFKSARSG